MYLAKGKCVQCLCTVQQLNLRHHCYLAKRYFLVRVKNGRIIAFQFALLCTCFWCPILSLGYIMSASILWMNKSIKYVVSVVDVDFNATHRMSFYFSWTKLCMHVRVCVCVCVCVCEAKVNVRITYVITEVECVVLFPNLVEKLFGRQLFGARNQMIS